MSQPHEQAKSIWDELVRNIKNRETTIRALADPSAFTAAKAALVAKSRVTELSK